MEDILCPSRPPEYKHPGFFTFGTYIYKTFSAPFDPHPFRNPKYLL